MHSANTHLLLSLSLCTMYGSRVALMSDAAASAYARLLVHIVEEAQKSKIPLDVSQFYDLWPKKADIVANGGT